MLESSGKNIAALGMLPRLIVFNQLAM